MCACVNFDVVEGTWGRRLRRIKIRNSKGYVHGGLESQLVAEPPSPLPATTVALYEIQRYNEKGLSGAELGTHGDLGSDRCCETQATT